MEAGAGGRGEGVGGVGTDLVLSLRTVCWAGGASSDIPLKWILRPASLWNFNIQKIFQSNYCFKSAILFSLYYDKLKSKRRFLNKYNSPVMASSSESLPSVLMI